MWLLAATSLVLAADGPAITLRLPPGPGNPRNSEGDLLHLGGGRVLLIYTRFSGGGEDHAAAELTARESRDGGLTWSAEDRLVVANEARQNVMSVTLLRLADGRVALFYLRKNSNEDCRPVVRFSTDEGASWGDAIEVVGPDAMGYYVLNNDRVIQLRSGRLIVPLARHWRPGQERWSSAADIVLYLSDDGGATWRPSRSIRTGELPGRPRAVLQEPGVLELAGGAVMIYCRADTGTQRTAYSLDGGETFGEFHPSALVSPLSPASLARLPDGAILAVWNDHDQLPGALRGKRTPLCTAISRDEGRSWTHVNTLYDDPEGWYCYTAIEVVGEAVLLAHCAGERPPGNGLEPLHVTRVPLSWLYSGVE